MTNPVILLGTQSNGETLPVQVDAFGRLVAEGLQGSEGPEGPQGPEGPEGPPGPPGIELPPDPYEGALLGWLNNELAWVGTPPVPIPEYVFGPITSWEPQNGYLEVDGPIPAEVGNGVYVWQCNPDGSYFTEGWDTRQMWSDTLVSSGNWPINPFERAFNGNTGVGADATGGTDQATRVITGFGGFYPSGSGPYSVEIAATGNMDGYLNNGSPVPGVSDGWAVIGSTDQVETIKIVNARTTGGVYLRGLRINGKELVNTNYSVNMRVNQTLGNALIGVSSGGLDFTVGKYLMVPPQRVAPWVLYGNDPTSLIDHLRSS